MLFQPKSPVDFNGSFESMRKVRQAAAFLEVTQAPSGNHISILIIIRGL